jgi:hypothetical protein
MWATASKAIGVALPKPLEVTFHYHVSQMLDMKLQYLLLSLLDFSLA